MGNLSKIVLDDETLEVEDTKARTDIGDVTYLKTAQKGSIVDAVNECFQYASDGKKEVADAITGMGVPTSKDDTFATMADNISKIETGIDTSGATAISDYILEGKTAGVCGEMILGTMRDNTLLKYGDDYVLPEFPTQPIYEIDTKNRDVRYVEGWGANGDWNGLSIVPKEGYWPGIGICYCFVKDKTLEKCLKIDPNKMLDSLTIAGVTGNIINRVKWTWCIDVIDSGEAIDVVPQVGYYDGARDSCTCIQYSKLRDVLGIKPEMIVKGYTICGVAGTAITK